MPSSVSAPIINLLNPVALTFMSDLIPFRPGIALLSMMLGLLLLTACSSNGWLVDDPRIGQRNIYVAALTEEVFDFDEERLSPELMEELRSEAADSLMRSALDKTRRAYQDTPQAIQVSNSEADADIRFQVEQLRIYRVRTLNVVHPGPVFKVEIEMAGQRGTETIFLQKESRNSNLAVTAADGARFYIPSSEERMDTGLQRETIYPVLESVFGNIWQEAVDQNRKQF